MQTAKLLLAAFALASATAACGGGDAPDPTANARPTATVTRAPSSGAPPASPAAGAEDLGTARADYSQTCINCHKADGAGGEVKLDSGGTLKVPSLREAGLKDSDAELADQIRDGGGGMPPFKNRLSDKQIGDLVRFIRKEFHGR